MRTLLLGAVGGAVGVLVLQALLEFREEEVRAWNPCGLISLGVAVAVGALGVIEVYSTYYASFLAMVIGPLLHVAITAATRGRYYEPAHAGAKHEGDR